MCRFKYSVGIPLTIYRAPEPEFPKTAVEIAGETAGESQSAGGVLGELLRRLLVAENGPFGTPSLTPKSAR